jgi:hypothetical protein
LLHPSAEAAGKWRWSRRPSRLGGRARSARPCVERDLVRPRAARDRPPFTGDRVAWSAAYPRRAAVVAGRRVSVAVRQRSSPQERPIGGAVSAGTRCRGSLPPRCAALRGRPG